MRKHVINNTTAPKNTEPDEKKLTAQFTMLGKTGAGKTCYLAGMYKKMSSTINGYSLSCKNNEESVELDEIWQGFTSPQLENRFPAGTDNTKQYEFELRYRQRIMMDFSWIDYSGSLISKRDQGDTNIQLYSQLCDIVKNSDCLLICIDSNEALKETNSKKRERKIEEISSYVNHFFDIYMDSNQVIPPVCIVLTKYDTVPNCIEEYCNEIKSSFTFLASEDADKKEKQVTYIVPVSLGENLNKEGSAELDPRDMYVPLFFAIWHKIATISKHAEDETKKYKAQIDEMKKDLEILDKKRFFRKSKVKQLKQQIEAKTIVYKQKQAMVETYRRYTNLLREGLGDRPDGLYFNGRLCNSWNEVIL